MVNICEWLHKKEANSIWKKFSVFSSYFYSLLKPKSLDSDKFFHIVLLYCVIASVQ